MQKNLNFKSTRLEWLRKVAQVILLYPVVITVDKNGTARIVLQIMVRPIRAFKVPQMKFKILIVVIDIKEWFEHI